MENNKTETSINFQAEKEEVTETKLLLRGKQKQLFVSLKLTLNKLVMQDSIQNKFIVSEKPKNETTLLYLNAVKIALTKAAENMADFSWEFNPSDPEHKMSAWMELHRDKFKTFIPRKETEQELNKINTALASVSENEHIEIQEWENLSLKDSNSLAPGQKLKFDDSDDGRNLASHYGPEVTFIEYKTLPTKNHLPLIVVETTLGKKTISPSRLKRA